MTNPLLTAETASWRLHGCTMRQFLWNGCNCRKCDISDTTLRALGILYNNLRIGIALAASAQKARGD